MVIVEMKSLVMDLVFGVIQTRSIGLQKMGGRVSRLGLDKA